MDLSELIITELEEKPPRIVLHGLAGIGKSTFGSKAPSPIFIQTEDGLTKIKVPKFQLATEIDSIYLYLDKLISDKHEHKTLVIDTVDWLEKIMWNHVCNKNNVKNIVDIGFGKGYLFAMDYWDEIIVKLNTLRNDRNMAILLIAHNEIKTFKSPDSESYDRYQIKLHKLAAALIEEWADIILFANYKVYVDDKSKRGVGQGERVLYSEERPAWKAKNRYGLPFEMDFDFNNVLNYIKKGK